MRTGILMLASLLVIGCGATHNVQENDPVVTRSSKSTLGQMWECSDGTDTEYEAVGFKYIYKFQYEVECNIDETEADDTKAGVRINIEVDDRKASYSIETKHIAFGKVLDIDSSDPDFAWKDFAKYAFGASLAGTAEVIVETLGDRAEETAVKIPGVDQDVDGKITMKDAIKRCHRENRE
jgi:hypothetical protein